MIELTYFETTHVSGGVSSATLLGAFSATGAAIGAGTYYMLALASLGGAVGGGLGAGAGSPLLGLGSVALSGLAGAGFGLVLGGAILGIGAAI